MNGADKKLLWLAAFVCIPNWSEAARAATGRTAALGIEMNLLRDGNLRDISPRALLNIADHLKHDHYALSLAWRLLALRPADDKTLVHEVVSAVVSVLASIDGDATEALSRLRVWDAVAIGKFTDADFFKVASQYWRGEREYIVARLDEQSRCSSGIPACMELLGYDRWDEAFMWLSKQTQREFGKLGIYPPSPHKDRKKQVALIASCVEVLFAQGRKYTGELALAWQMMLCTPTRPESFNSVLPQIDWLLNNGSVIISAGDKARYLDRIDVWWRAARGEYSTSEVSIFRIAERETAANDYDDRRYVPLEPEEEADSPVGPYRRRDAQGSRGGERAADRRGRICVTSRCRSWSAAMPPRCASACRTSIRTRGARSRC